MLNIYLFIYTTFAAVHAGHCTCAGTLVLEKTTSQRGSKIPISYHWQDFISRSYLTQLFDDCPEI